MTSAEVPVESPTSDEARDAAGRAANDPSLSHANGVHEAFQAPPGKPDGEVDTRG